MKLLVIVEQTDTGFSAYAPDLPGCAATGGSRAEVERMMGEAVAFHLEGMQAAGVAPPESHTYATTIEVAA